MICRLMRLLNALQTCAYLMDWTAIYKYTKLRSAPDSYSDKLQEKAAAMDYHG